MVSMTHRIHSLCVKYFYTSRCVVLITLTCYTDKFGRKQPTAIPIKEGCVATCTTEAMEVAACFGWKLLEVI